jgi:hypothetical protein
MSRWYVSIDHNVTLFLYYMQRCFCILSLIPIYYRLFRSFCFVFCHSTSPVFYLVSDDSIFDFDSEIKCENENEIWVISTNLVRFDLLGTSFPMVIP